MAETLTVKAFHADGTCYRWWRAQQKFVNEQGAVTETKASNAIFDVKGDWTSRNHIRTFYWFDRPYNLLEVYELDGTLAELYIHIASQARSTSDELHYVDYELDVVMYPGKEPFIADEDDFQLAISMYNYSDAFQAQCREACQEALALIARWQPGVPPEEGLRLMNDQ